MNPYPVNAQLTFEQIYKWCKPYSMAMSEGRAEFLYQSALSVIDSSLEGDFVESGVWEGGNCMILAHLLKEKGEKRTIWMYDTFQGMTEPTEHDVFHTGKHASEIDKEDWCKADWRKVLNNMQSTGYKHFQLVQGKVEDTIPGIIPDKIALLRLDTDFYSSTKHELKHLYPRLVGGGVLIVDDYWSWRGCRKAVDEYGLELERIETSNAGYLVK